MVKAQMMASKISCALSCGLALLFALPALAQSLQARAEIRGFDMGGYGRIVITLDEMPDNQIAIRNGILIWSFAKPLKLRVEKLPVELGRFIAGARLDPDSKILRLALAQDVKYNLQDAGQDLYLDLLPKNFSGANPPLPADIVRDLSRRVREADAQNKARDAALAIPLQVDGGMNKGNGVLRLSEIEADRFWVSLSDHVVMLRLAGRYRIEEAKLLAALPKDVRLQSMEQIGENFMVKFSVDPSIRLRTNFDDRALTIEFRREKSGEIDLDGPGLARLAEWTGSIDGNPSGEPPGLLLHGDISVRASITDGRPMVELVTSAPLPLAVFQTATKVVVMIDTERSLDLDLAGNSADQGIQNLRPLQLNKAKGIMFARQAFEVPHVTRSDQGYTITLLPRHDDALQDFDVLAVPDQQDRPRLVIPFADASTVLSFEDPETGEAYAVIPSTMPKLGFHEGRDFFEFSIVPSMQGIAVKKRADDVVVSADAGAMIITRPNGLAAVTLADGGGGEPRNQARSIIRAQAYPVVATDQILSGIRALTERILGAEPQDRAALRIKLARFYAAHELFREAAAAMERVFSERIPNNPSAAERLEQTIYLSLAGDHTDALASLNTPDMKDLPDAALFQAYNRAQQAQFTEAMAAYRNSGSAISSYPVGMVKRILPVLAEAALEAHDLPLASNFLASLPSYISDDHREFYRYLSARYLELSGQKDDARIIYIALSEAQDRRASVRARLALLSLTHDMTPANVSARLASYQLLGTIWRGDWVEAKSVTELARLSFQAGDWRRGFLAMQKINQVFADYPGARALMDTATSQLEALLDEHNGPPVGPVEAVSLFMDYREFMPVGRRGDDVIRKLADKLVALDLLPQAAELMRYQIVNRLDGPARAAAAPRLAYILLLDKKPREALQALADTRMNGMTDTLNRSRLLLEARARADLGDIDAAFELVETLSGDDVDRLRSEIAWRAKDWTKAAGAAEIVIGDKWKDETRFDDENALHALRAAIGYALTDDRLSLDRIRGRYLKKFAERNDLAAFKFLTAPTAKTSPFDSEYAATYKGGNAIDAFMTFYREQYLKSPTPQGDAKSSPNAAPG